MRYYSTLRPITPGSYPMKDRAKEIVNFDDKQYVKDIEHDAWGYIEYDCELSTDMANSYDLLPEGMTTWYCVTSSFYDNGKVSSRITGTIKSVNKPESCYKELKRCDVYADWYETKTAAEKAVQEALKA